MDTKQLAIFLSVARYLNFTRAAQQHYMTQPAISHHISELEKELDAQLFIRSSHNVELTTAGEEFRLHAMEILSKSEIARSTVYNVSHGKTGRLKILTVQASIDTVVSCLSLFAKRYPNIFTDVELVTGATQMNAINNDDADIYFTFSSLLKSYEQMECKILTRTDFALLLPETYMGAVDIHDFSFLKDMPLVSEMRSEAPFLAERVLQICHNRKLRPSNIHWCSSALSLLIAVRSGLGFAINPLPTSSSGFSDEIRMIKLDGDDTAADNSIGWKRNTKNLATKYFLDIIHELYPEEQA